MQDKLLTYRIQIDGKNVRKLLGEWELFELIVYQLVSNAIKFSNVGGCITVTVYILRSQDQQHLLKTTIIDSGTGILQGKLDSMN